MGSGGDGGWGGGCVRAAAMTAAAKAATAKAAGRGATRGARVTVHGGRRRRAAGSERVVWGGAGGRGSKRQGKARGERVARAPFEAIVARLSYDEHQRPPRPQRPESGSVWGVGTLSNHPCHGRRLEAERWRCAAGGRCRGGVDITQQARAARLTGGGAELVLVDGGRPRRARGRRERAEGGRAGSSGVGEAGLRRTPC